MASKIPATVITGFLGEDLIMYIGATVGLN